MAFEEQKQRILQGKMCNDLTPELVEARRTTVELTSEYNASYGQAPEIQGPILKKLLKNVEEHAFFEPGPHCEFGFNISVRKNFYANFDCILSDPGPIEIRGHVLSGPRVSIYTARHVYNAAERTVGACFAKPVKIGNHVWVEGGAHMDHGTTIGDSTIIGAGSIITRGIPANVVATDVPCKVMRPITEGEKTDHFGMLKKYQEDGHEDTIHIRSGRNPAE